MIIATDFDGTLFWCYGVGGTSEDAVPNGPLIAACKRWQELGHTLILWTCRGPGTGLEEALALCEQEGLHFKYANENCPEILNSCGDRRKIVADLYIDDRAVRMTSDPGGSWEAWTKHAFKEHNAVYM